MPWGQQQSDPGAAEAPLEVAGGGGVSWKTKAGLGIDVSERNGLQIWLFLKPGMTHSFKENFLRSDIYWARKKHRDE